LIWYRYLDIKILYVDKLFMSITEKGCDMWDAGQYLRFGGERARPFFDLVAQVGATSPRYVADLGCGPGNLTALLAERWPGAAVEAYDNSPEMVAKARENGVDARLAGVEDWTPAPDTDVVVTNAVLHWVPGHRELLRRWAGQLPPGAWLAQQVPANFTAPSGVLARQVAARPEWAPRLASAALLGPDAVDPARGYADLLTTAGCEVDAWETTYVQRLHGPDAVLEWITGSSLHSVRTALGADWPRFRAQLAPRLNEAYPPRPDGTTWFEFRRIFVVARTAA
jgi:trans-aconitate 2-methyltransferase